MLAEKESPLSSRSRSGLRLVPAAETPAALRYEEEELARRAEREIIESIRAEAEEMAFEEAEREAALAVQEDKKARVKSPRLRGPPPSPLEAQRDSESEEPTPRSDPPSPSAIPRHQRLVGYERRSPSSQGSDRVDKAETRWPVRTRRRVVAC